MVAGSIGRHDLYRLSRVLSMTFCDPAKNCFMSAHVGLRHIGQRLSRRRLQATFAPRCDLTTSDMAYNMTVFDSN